MVSEETTKRRLSRAKAKIKATGIPFAVPDARLLPDRLDAVLAVIYLIYLIYNEGYSGRANLGDEAIRFGRVLAALMPEEPEVHGLLRPDGDPSRPSAGTLQRRRSHAARRPGPVVMGAADLGRSDRT